VEPCPALSDARSISLPVLMVDFVLVRALLFFFAFQVGNSNRKDLTKGAPQREKYPFDYDSHHSQVPPPVRLRHFVYSDLAKSTQVARRERPYIIGIIDLANRQVIATHDSLRPVCNFYLAGARRCDCCPSDIGIHIYLGVDSAR